MRDRPGVTPIGAVVRGAVAGALGTAAMDLVWFARYKRAGGQQSLLAWETAEGVDTWNDASPPGQLGKRLAEAVLQRELPDQWARTMTNVVHWATGLSWGALYGIIAGSTRDRRSVYGVAFGPFVWLAGYVILPLAKVYKPMWEYDAKTLAQDLSAHVVYGATTGAAFAILTR
jgi:hypothetical protein